jgi:hypothetical protein
MRASLCFVLAALAPAFAPTVSPAQQPLTARDVALRIKQNIGVPWTEPTVDTFKDGDPATPVTGVAVTMMATFDVLQRAAAHGGRGKHRGGIGKEGSSGVSPLPRHSCGFAFRTRFQLVKDLELIEPTKWSELDLARERAGRLTWGLYRSLRTIAFG